MISPELKQYLGNTESKILEYLSASDVRENFRPIHIADSIDNYLFKPAKRLRPSVLSIIAGATGGETKEMSVIPAAAAIELFHTWTLVHDDVIDNDDMRRGSPTVHSEMRMLAESEFNLTTDLASSYGEAIAILTGDMQHGWTTYCFLDLFNDPGIDRSVIIKLLRILQSTVLSDLIYGETLDVQYSYRPLSDLSSFSDTKVLEMLRLKTGVLYEFAGTAGAMIGYNSTDIKKHKIDFIQKFCLNCGIAFQLQDDILGVVGDEELLGKPVGSDIREGKKTTIYLDAIKKANSKQKNIILSTMGNGDATESDIEEVANLFLELDSVEKTKLMAENIINEALPMIDHLSNSKYKDLLLDWADFMIHRDF